MTVEKRPHGQSERNTTPTTSTGRNVFSLAMPPQRDYRKKIIFHTAVAWTFLSGGILFRYLLIPNQVLITAAGMFFFIFASLVLSLKENLQACDGIPEVWHKSGYASTALMFWGYFNGWERDVGFWALVFYAALVLMISYFAAILWKTGARGERRKQFRNIALVLVSMALLSANLPLPPQLPDIFFNASIDTPAYSTGTGPIVFFDEGHHNFHTMADKYRPFADLLRKDGYRTRAFHGPFGPGTLSSRQILVIANALHLSSVGDWTRPPASAFADEEIVAVRNWVRSGGSLFLIADHTPFAGAAGRLAAEFGFEFRNGYASQLGQSPDVFTRKNDMLKSCVLTDGTNGFYRVDQVMTFVGQAFSIPDDALAVLVLDGRYRLWHSANAWRKHDPTDADPIEGLAQLAYKEFGKGRMVVAGEAAMFSAQLDEGRSWRPMGMNAPGAEQNWRLTLNIIHWLGGSIP